MPDDPAPSPTSTDSSHSRDSPSAIPELVAIGQEITAARQARGLDLHALAERLCIGHEQLQALEQADTLRLPERVFVIAQLRRVAASLGLDAEEAVAALRASGPARAGEAKPTRTRRGQTAATLTSRSPSSPRSGAPTRGGLPSSGAWLAGAGLLLAAAAVGLAPLWHRTSSAPGGDGASTSTSGAARNSSEATSGSGIPPSAAKAAAPAAPARLVLRSREPSWLEVRDSQGATLFEGTLEGEKSFPLGQGLRVMAGRPDLVQAEVAGQEARVLGPISQVIWRTFTAKPAPAAAEAPTPPAVTPPAP